MRPDGNDHRQVRLAARAMARHGLSHAYGHVSTRLDEARFLVSPAAPLGVMSPSQCGVIVHLDEALPAEALPEVRIHREIYRRRADVGGVCRVQPPHVMTLSTLGRTPRALHGLGAYFAPHAPLWRDPALVRTDEGARAVASELGDARAIVLRGNGVVAVGASLMHAAGHAFFLEDAARIEVALLGAEADPIAYTAEEAAKRAVGAGQLYERMWQYLCAGDPEWQPTRS